jgi:tetratricopeptide (TPR) repeat protein
MPDPPPIVQLVDLVKETAELLVAGKKAFDDEQVHEAEHLLEECQAKARAGLDLSRRAGFASVECDMLSTVGASLLLRKKFHQAREAYQACLVLAERLGSLSKQQSSLETLGLICVEMGDLAPARDYCERALEMFESRRAGLAAEEHQIAFAQQAASLYGNLIAVCIEQRANAAALEFAEKAKSRALSALLGASRLGPPPHCPTALARREDELLARVDKIVVAWRLTTEKQVATRDRLWNEWIELRQELEKVWDQIGRVSGCAQYVALRRGTPPNLSALRTSLA